VPIPMAAGMGVDLGALCGGDAVVTELLRRSDRVLIGHLSSSFEDPDSQDHAATLKPAKPRQTNAKGGPVPPANRSVLSRAPVAEIPSVFEELG
jgi:hypothetical protein